MATPLPSTTVEDPAVRFWRAVSPVLPHEPKLVYRELPEAGRDQAHADYGRRGGPCLVCGRWLARGSEVEFFHPSCVELALRHELIGGLVREPGVPAGRFRCHYGLELLPVGSLRPAPQLWCDHCAAYRD